MLQEAAPLPPLEPNRVEELLDAGATLLDGREPREYDADHIPRSLNVTMAKAAVGTRAVSVVDPDADVVVVAASDERRADPAAGRMLEAVGFSKLRGYLAGGSRRGRSPAVRSRRRRRSTYRRRQRS